MNQRSTYRAIHMLKIKLEPRYDFFKYLWIFIIFPKPIQLAILLVFSGLMYITDKTLLKRNICSVCLVIVICIQTLAIITDLIRNPGDVNRAPAAFNTLMLWVVAIVFYTFYYKKDIDLSRIGKYCVWNLIVNFLLSAVAFVEYYVRHIPEMAFCGRMLYGTTWLNGHPTVKCFALNDFSNMNLLYIMLQLMVAAFYLDKKSKIKKAFVIICASFSVWMIHSRTGMVVFTLAIVVYIISQFPKKYKKAFVIFIVFLATMIATLEFKNIYNFFYSKILFGNVSSTEYRVDLQFTSIRTMLRESPLIGIGIKRIFRPGEAFVAYLGSHSTYIGLLYKIGMCGFLFGMIAVLYPPITVLYKYRHNYYLKQIWGIIIACLITLFLEDVDGSNWLIIFYFSIFQIIYFNIHKGNSKWTNLSTQPQKF